MTKVIFDLDYRKGGRRDFPGIAEAILWVEEQRNLWGRHFSPEKLQSQPVIGVLESRFSMVRGDLDSRIKDRLQSDEAVVFTDPGLVSTDSVLAVAIWRVEDSIGLGGVPAVLFVSGITQEINWRDPDTVSAIAMLNFMIDSARDRDEDSLARGSRGQFETLQEEIVKARGEVAQMGEASRSFIEQAQRGSEIATVMTETQQRTLLEAVETAEKKAQMQYQRFEEKIDEAGRRLGQATEATASSLGVLDGELLAFRNSQAEKLEAWLSSQQEAYRLKAPAQLWDERAATHQAKATRQRYWAVGIGVVGLIATLFVAQSAYWFAHELFADATIDPMKDFAGPELVKLKRQAAVRLAQSVGETAPLRETFHAELVLSATITLLWLTLFIWAMRVAVKVYTTEHHLAINASARAAMVTTYLGLINEKAANEADRPIVLGAIFQPINDGFNSDDGPPPMSMASLAATVAAGKGG